MLKRVWAGGAVVAASMTMLATTAVAQDHDAIKFARYPAVSNDGTLAFCYHGDIWLADADGSNPRRLTAHIAEDRFPRFSPDGQHIAFNSDRMGNTDIWLVPIEGGEPEQLTHHSTGDTLLYWTPDGDGIVFSSSRGTDPWGSPLYIAPLDGSMPEPLGMDRGASGMIKQDGSMIAFNRIGFRYWRKGYRGNNNTDIYVQNLTGDDHSIRQLTDLDLKNFRNHTQDGHPMWGEDGMIYFMSERDGIFNIWRISPNGGEPEQMTNHRKDGVQYPSISPDGTTIVYENEFELWKYDVANSTTTRVPLHLEFDPKQNYIEYVNVDNRVDGFAPSHDGQRVAVDEHGEIFTVPVDAEKGEKSQITDSAWRDRYQSYSPDGKYLAYITDESGDEEIWLHELKSNQRRQLTEHESTKRSYMWSPDAKQIVFEADNRMFLVDVETGEQDELAHNPEGGYSLSAFSDDGAWLIYSRSNKDLNRDVYLFNIADREEINITQHRFTEYGGDVTSDGKHVVFISDRDGTRHLYAVSLTKRTYDPNDPLAEAPKPSNGRNEKKDESEGDDAQGDEEAETDDEPIGVDSIEIDLDGIDRRPWQLSTGNDSVGSAMLIDDDKKVLYTQGNTLWSVDLYGENRRKVADGRLGGLQMTADGKWLFFSDGGQIHRMNTSGGARKPISFRFRVKVDHKAEWEQVFEEAWRVMKYRFYDPDMHGVDWDAMKAKYKPMLKYVGENQDLYDLCNEMIGELNASHTGVNGPPTRSMPSTAPSARRPRAACRSARSRIMPWPPRSASIRTRSWRGCDACWRRASSAASVSTA